MVIYSGYTYPGNIHFNKSDTKCLNNLMVLSIHTVEVDNVDMKCIVSDFIKIECRVV